MLRDQLRRQEETALTPRSYTRGPQSPRVTGKIPFRGALPGGPVVKTSLSTAGGAGSTPGLGAKIPYALWPKSDNTK